MLTSKLTYTNIKVAQTHIKLSYFSKAHPYLPIPSKVTHSKLIYTHLYSYKARPNPPKIIHKNLKINDTYPYSSKIHHNYSYPPKVTNLTHSSLIPTHTHLKLTQTHLY